MSNVVALILGSAAIGALISSVVNGLFLWWSKSKEFEQQDMAVALKLAELKHQQILAVQEWNIKGGQSVSVEFWDPLVTVISYRRGMREFRTTGHWTAGEKTHGKTP